MDRVLADALNKLNTQNQKLREVENIFRQLEATSKTLWAQLFLQAQGKNVSEREAQVASSKDWSDFAKGLAEAESAYNFERRRFEILNNAFIAELNSFKAESALIKKQV